MSRVQSSRDKGSRAQKWTLLDWKRPSIVVDSDEHLASELKSLPESGLAPNRIVELESPGGDRLSMGIAGPTDTDNPTLQNQVACLNFTNASHDPPYLTAVGDSNLTFENGGVVVFRFDDQWTEILRRNCVPVDVMIRAAQHFYRTGTLPNWIEWEEV